MKRSKTKPPVAPAAKAPTFGFETLAFPALLLLLLLPAFYFQVTTDETFKVSTEFIAVALCWLFVVVTTGLRALAGKTPLSGGRGSRARWMAIALLGWLAVTSVAGYHPAASWSYAFTVLAYLLAAQAIVDWIELRPLHRTLALAALGALVGLEVLISIAQFLRVPMLAWGQATPVFTAGDQLLPGGYWLRDYLIAIGTPAKDGMVTGTLGNINYLAELVVLTTPVLVLWGLGARRPWLKRASIAAGLVILLLLVTTATRAALLGALVAGAIVGVRWLGVARLHPRNWWSKPNAKLFTGIAAAVLVLALLVPGGPGARLVAKLSNIQSDASIASRLDNWKAAGALWLEHPVAGVGLGGYKLTNTAKLAELNPTGVSDAVASARFLQAHSDPLQALVELGAVGFGLAIGALVLWMRETWRNPSLGMPLRAGLVAGVGALLVASGFGFPFHIPLTGLALMVVLALGIARDQEPSAAKPLPRWRVAYALGLSVLAGLVGWQCVEKGVLPLYLAHRYEYVAEKLKKAQSFEAAEKVLTLADRHNRFKGSVRWQLLQMKIVNNKPDEALALFAASEKEGLGMDSWYWKGRAHQMKRQFPEALAAYQKLVNYYDSANSNHTRAVAQMQVIHAEIAKAATPNP